MARYQAIWKDTVIADSDPTVAVEGNQYFPSGAVKQEYLQPSETHSRCFWKGKASYFDVLVDGQRNGDAAWFYPEPTAAARKIAGRIAFWHGVKVSRLRDESADEAVSSRGGWLRRLFGS
jgi:uncharacterized protein (DUF427 family)